MPTARPHRSSRHRARGALRHGFIALTVTLGVLAGGASAQAGPAPKTPKRPCGHYALVLQHVASVDLYDLNGDGWHCSGPLVPRPGGTDPVLFADNTRVPKPRRAAKYFLAGVESGAKPSLTVKPRRNRYTAEVAVEEGDAPFEKTFRYDRSDRFYLNYGNESAVGGSRRVTLRTFEQALRAASLTPYYHPVRLDVLYSPKTARSSVFSLYTAPDESPSLNDVATLRSGQRHRGGEHPGGHEPDLSEGRLVHCVHGDADGRLRRAR